MATRLFSPGDSGLRRFRIAFLFATLLTQCLFANEESDDSQLQDQLLATIQRIDKIAADKSCYETDHCASLPVGYKACGGPAKIVIYSTKIGHDAVLELLALAEHSTQIQRKINEIKFAISDCAMRVPGPLMCHERRCIELSSAYSQENVMSAKVFLASVVYTDRLAGLSDSLSKREISHDVRQRILFQSAQRISDCVFAPLTTNPDARTEPFIDALAYGYDDEDIHERIAATYDAQVADEQIKVIRPMLDSCVEAEEMSVLSIYPRS